MGLGPLSPSYSSGHDFSVEVDGVRFAFSAGDFASRIGAAAVRLGLIARDRLGDAEIADLVALAAHGAVSDPRSPLAAHIDEHAGRLLGGDADLVHWLCRLVFTGAWVDQQVADGTLVPEFDEARGFRYRSAATGQPAADEATVPDWSAIAYRGTA